MTSPNDPAYDFTTDNDKNLCYIIWNSDNQRAKDEAVKRGYPKDMTREQAMMCMHKNRFQFP